MTGFPSKIIGLVIVFVMLVLGPTLRSVQMDSISQRRELYNEVTNMLDNITDSGQITNQTIEDFYLGVASKGIPVDVQIERYVKVVNPDGQGGTYYTYTYSDEINDWNKGDICKIKVTQLTETNLQKLSYNLSKMYTKPIDFTFAGRVRN